MSGRTVLARFLERASHNICLFLVVLLGMVSLGWGQEPQTDGRRRTARTTRPRTVQLPEPTRSTSVSVEQALLRLLELAPPSDQRLQPDQIGQLLWAGQGVAFSQTGDAVAQAALPAMRIYVVSPEGVFVYYPAPHALQQLNDGDLRQSVARTVLDQQAGPIGGCQIILAGVTRDFSTRFGNRARNIMHLQAGQMAQSIQLEAVCQDLTFVANGNFDGNALRRACRLPRDNEPLYALLVGTPVSQTTETVQSQPTEGPARRAVFIVPPAGFQDEELFATKRGLELASVQTVIASTRIGVITGSAGGVAQSELLVNRVAVENFDAVVFIGGSGAATLLGNQAVLTLAQRAATLRRVVAASGNAPAILANAGIIAGARVTGLLAERDRLLLAGAIYTGSSVERDGPLVTSAGPRVVPQFVMAILDALATR